MHKGKRILAIIPARGGSKGVPYKNIKPLNGKPLIEYTIDNARSILNDEDICVSTDDDKIIRVVENYGLKIPFKRPDYLATDTAGTYEVILHALEHYERIGKTYDIVLLMQTTTPLRQDFHIKEALELYSDDLDMVVSVKESVANPYFNLFEENESGYLFSSKGDGDVAYRQEAPKVYEYNGAIYIINIKSLKKSPLSKFTKRVKYVMGSRYSIDIDTQLDWEVAELLINKLT